MVGTGSGLGSSMMELLRDEFPSIYRFSCAVFPSEDDDVVTSPYNAILSTNVLLESSDVVLPIENQALIDMCAAIDKKKKNNNNNVSGNSNNGVITRGNYGHSSGGNYHHDWNSADAAGGSSAETDTTTISYNKNTGKRERRQPFAAMNGIAANMLLHLTSSVRFQGSLNTDLNEIIMNLVPFPKQQFLLSSLSPLAGSGGALMPTSFNNSGTFSRGVDSMLSSLFAREHQLMKADPRNGTFISCGLFVRGKSASISDLARNVSRFKKSLKFVHWNVDGFKVGLCSVPPTGLTTSSLALSNNCCIRSTFTNMRDKFLKLYKKKVYVHHYTQYMEEDLFTQADEGVQALIQGYEDIDLNVNNTNIKNKNAIYGHFDRLQSVGSYFAV